MQILLDSAIIAEARQAAAWGWVKSVTTNPTLLAQSELPPDQALKELSNILPGQVFYQLTSSNLEDMQTEAAKAFDILGGRLVLKIPATALGFQATSVLSKKYTCAVTSIYSPAQAMVAHMAGAKYAVYYHNRAKRFLPEEESAHLPSEMVAVLNGTETEVVAASFRSTRELVEVRLAGVTIMTAKFNVLSLMAQHELSDKALEEFNTNGTGLSS